MQARPLLPGAQPAELGPRSEAGPGGVGLGAVVAPVGLLNTAGRRLGGHGGRKPLSLGAGNVERASVPRHRWRLPCASLLWGGQTQVPGDSRDSFTAGRPL